MWNPFRKKKSSPPVFKLIEQYSNKDKYPTRTKAWDWLNQSQIYIPHKNEEGQISMNTFDFWLQEIFLYSTGDQTIREIFEKMKEQYRDSQMGIPKELQFVELKDAPIQLKLKEEFLLPISAQKG